jgi:hypothetical protein
MSGGRHTAAGRKTDEERTPRSISGLHSEILSVPWTGGVPCDDLPVVCCTDSTRCGAYLTSDGPCRRYALRGCPLRRHGKTRGHRRNTRARPTNSGNSAIPSVATKEEVVPV